MRITAGEVKINTRAKYSDGAMHIVVPVWVNKAMTYMTLQSRILAVSDIRLGYKARED